MSRRENTHDGIKDVVKPFDWSYTTDYTGTLAPNAQPFEPTTKPIPIELLKRPDPILFFDDVILYEDELADNGITMFSCKVRAMPDRLLLLARLFMRLDNVLIRLRDTRVYIDFDTKEVIREYQAKECDYEQVRQVRVPRPVWMPCSARTATAKDQQALMSARDDIPAVMRDPNRLSEILPVVERRLESVTLAG